MRWSELLHLIFSHDGSFGRMVRSLVILGSVSDRVRTPGIFTPSWETLKLPDP